jgi:hypothetical protein
VSDRPPPPGPDAGARPLGGRVERTGIALVRKGELVVPYEGSEAEIVLAEQDARHEIHVHLPVVVEVRGRDDDAVVAAAAEEALRQLRVALEQRGGW